jgi:hypothetical protein
METPTSKKTANINKYMNEYMTAKYHQNPVKAKMYKNSLYIRKKYKIDETIWNKYKENLHHIVLMKNMIDELPNDVFLQFLAEHKTLVFEPIDNLGKTE